MPDCGETLHATAIGQYLEKQLPNFHLRTIQHPTGEWEHWLNSINHKYKWHHTKSPLIWKELAMRGGTPLYVGDLSEFWEYCYDYYGLESRISPADLQNMIKDNMQYYKDQEKRKKSKVKNIRHVCIYGDTASITTLLLPELLKLNELKMPNGISIKLFDSNIDDNKNMKYLEEIIYNIETLATNGNETVTVANSLQHAIKDCEILIIVGDTKRSSRNLDEMDWLIKNVSDMYELSDAINGYGRRDLKIIVALNFLSCFNATILIDACAAVRIQNIVAVTSDVGLSVLHYTAKQTNLQLKQLGGPPVWGFVGSENLDFVDIESIVICSDLYCPYQRALQNDGGSTLPLGTVQSELRLIGYLIQDVEGIKSQVKNAKLAINNQLQRPPSFAKVRSIISLLKLWYAKAPSDEVISLGVCSNGSFGIPSGIVFSQPVILEKNIWVPYKNFPTSIKTRAEIQRLVTATGRLMDQFTCQPDSISSLLL